MDGASAPRMLLVDWGGLWAVCVYCASTIRCPFFLQRSLTRPCIRRPTIRPNALTPRKINSETTIGEVVSTNGVELDAALDALSKKANAPETGARVEKLEKAVAEVGWCVQVFVGYILGPRGREARGIPVALDR